MDSLEKSIEIMERKDVLTRRNFFKKLGGVALLVAGAYNTLSTEQELVVTNHVQPLEYYPLTFEETLTKDTRYLSQFYEGFTTSDLFKIVRSVYREAGGNWHWDEKIRKKNQIEDIVPIIAAIANRWIASKYDEDLKKDFNGHGDVTFSNILEKKDGKVYQFSFMRSQKERDAIELAILNKDLFYGIEDQFEKEKIQFIYDITPYVLSYVAIRPEKTKIEVKNLDIEIPIGHDVFYKKINNEQGWDQKVLFGRIMDETKEIGHHKHYTLLDKETEENIIYKSRQIHSNKLEQLGLKTDICMIKIPNSFSYEHTVHFGR